VLRLLVPGCRDDKLLFEWNFPPAGTTDATCNAKGMTRVYWTSTDTSATRASSPNATNTCLDECVSPHSESAVSCTTPSTTSGVSVTFEKYDVAMCWCIGQLKAKVSGNLFSGLRALYQENNGFCADPAQVSDQPLFGWWPCCEVLTQLVQLDV